MWLDVDMSTSQTISLESAIAYSNLSIEGVVCDTVPRARIDWGDGTTPIWTDCKDVATLKHTYSTAKQYQIKLGGTIAWNSAYSDSPDSLSNFLTGITIPSRCPIRTFISYEGSIQSDLTKYHGAFQNCSKLSSIKGDFFNSLIASSTNYNAFDAFFNSCVSLTTIPEDFYKSVVPSYRFVKEGRYDRTDIRSTFFGCTGITEIPETLFSHFPSRITAVNTNGIFEKCSGVKSIPVNIYKNISPHVTICNSIANFYFWTQLKEIPESLFDIRETLRFFDLTLMFAQCTGINTDVPKLWENPRFQDQAGHTGCFVGCDNATNYADIPTEWKTHPNDISLYSDDSVLNEIQILQNMNQVFN